MKIKTSYMKVRKMKNSFSDHHRSNQRDAVAVEEQPKRMEKTLEHQAQVEAEVHVEEENPAELRNKAQTVKKSLDEQEHQAVNTLKCVCAKGRRAHDARRNEESKTKAKVSIGRVRTRR